MKDTVMLRPLPPVDTSPRPGHADAGSQSPGAVQPHRGESLSRLSLVLLVANVLGLALLLLLQTYSERRIDAMHRDHYQLSVIEADVLRQFLAINRVVYDPGYENVLPEAARRLEARARQLEALGGAAVADLADHLWGVRDFVLYRSGEADGEQPLSVPGETAPDAQAAAAVAEVHGTAALTGIRQLLDAKYRAISAETRLVNRWLLTATIGYALIALFTCWLLYARVGRRLKLLLAQIYGPMGAGKRLTIEGADEIGQVVGALNRSADRHQTMLDSLYRKNRALSDMQGVLFESQKTARLGSWKYTPALKKMEVSPVTAELTGEAAATARTPVEFFLAIARGPEKDMVARAMLGLTPQSPTAEFTLRRDESQSGGGVLFCRTRAEFSSDASARSYSGIVQDVTDQEELLTELRTANHELIEAANFRREIIDAMPARTAMLDHEGTIITTNQRWQDFALELDYHNLICPGANYLAVCEQAEQQGNPYSGQALRGLRALLSGESEHFELEYPFPGPGDERWFELFARRMQSDTEGVMLVVMHIDITSRKLAERELLDAAMRDELTGLQSRTGLIAKAKDLNSASEECCVACVLIDLKNFHDINDTYGVSAGDSILQQVAARVRGCLDDSDIVARVGGDEFGAMLNCLPDRDLDAVLTVLHKAFSSPFEVTPEVSVHCEVNAGVFVRPGENVEPELMLQRAELALFHHVEENSASPWKYYESRLEEHAHRRVALLSELRAAIEREEFELHYQPKVDLESGCLSGCEALVRWAHPVHGLIAPADFIPLAEKSELIVDLGDWILRDACRQIREWIDDGLSIVQVSLNISISQVRRENFVDNLKSVIDHYAINPAYLTLEITESVFADDPEVLINAFNELQSLGFRLSLDDFGTKYSSLLYLKNFRFNEIKLDQSFIRDMLCDPYCYELACMVISIAQTTDADVVAEGVETADVAAELRQLKCTTGQGFYFSLPLTEADFRWLLVERPILPVFPVERFLPRNVSLN